MEPAKNDLAAINASLTAATPDAQKYIPDQLASAQGDVAKLTASYDKQDYAAVVTGGPAVLSAAQSLATIAGILLLMRVTAKPQSAPRPQPAE